MRLENLDGLRTWNGLWQRREEVGPASASVRLVLVGDKDRELVPVSRSVGGLHDEHPTQLRILQRVHAQACFLNFSPNIRNSINAITIDLLVPAQDETPLKLASAVVVRGGGDVGRQNEVLGVFLCGQHVVV